MAPNHDNAPVPTGRRTKNHLDLTCPRAAKETARVKRTAANWLAACLALLAAAVACSTQPRRTVQLRTQSPSHRLEARTTSRSSSSADLSRGVLPLTEDAPAPLPLSTTQPAFPPAVDEPEWIPLADRANTFATLRPTAVGPTGNTWELRTPHYAFQILAGSRQARFDSTDLWLGFAPTLTPDGLLVHRIDWEKNIRPLLTPTAPPIAAPGRIVLDAGHGGSNLGTLSVLDRSGEKDYTLDWALRLAPLLTAGGWDVTLTRTNDVDLHVSYRTALAERVGADLFLSLHFNSAAPDLTRRGVETYCLTPVGLPSTLTRNYEDDRTLELPNNAFDDANLWYATRLHGALIRSTGAVDRGVRRARFMAVLREQRRPALLIEGGFLSNPQEAAKIASPAYRQLLAETVAACLNAFTPTRPHPADLTMTAPSPQAR